MTQVRGLTLIGALVLAAAIFGGCASSGRSYGHAFGGEPPRTPMGPSVDEIIQELELAEEPAAEVRGVLEASEDERWEIMAKPSGTRGPSAFDEVREELDDLRARTEMMLEPLLTDEQMARYRQIVDLAEAERERMAEEMKAGRPMGPGGGTGRRPGF